MKKIKIKEGFIGQRMMVLPPDILTSLQSNEVNMSFYITAIGYYPHANYHDRHRKDGCSDYIFIYCAKGEGKVEIENVIFDLLPNHYIIIKKNVRHHYYSSLKNPWTIYWAHIAGNQANYLFDRFYEDTKSCKPKTIAFEENTIKRFIRAITILENSFDSKNIEIVNIIILEIIASMIYKDQLDPAEISKIPIKKSIRYIKEHLTDKIRIDHLAEQENLSVSRFCELFKECTGYSPIQFVLLKKIQKSCQYLYFTDLSVKEIASKVGFEDPYYFSRAFKNIMGLPPTKYKKAYKK